MTVLEIYRMGFESPPKKEKYFTEYLKYYSIFLFKHLDFTYYFVRRYCFNNESVHILYL
jgi:hypothetical protein